MWLDRNMSENLEASHFKPQHTCLSEAWNYGLNRLFRQTDRVLVVNNDALFSPDTFERLMGYQLETGSVLLVGFQVTGLCLKCPQRERGEAAPGL